MDEVKPGSYFAIRYDYSNGYEFASQSDLSRPTMKVEDAFLFGDMKTASRCLASYGDKSFLYGMQSSKPANMNPEIVRVNASVESRIKPVTLYDAAVKPDDKWCMIKAGDPNTVLVRINGQHMFAEVADTHVDNMVSGNTQSQLISLTSAVIDILLRINPVEHGRLSHTRTRIYTVQSIT